jgi:hypothetical protein
MSIFKNSASKKPAIRYSDNGFFPPPLSADGGLAAIDIVSLALAADAACNLGLPMTVPSICQFDCPASYVPLIEVVARHGEWGLEVVATIDTGKMSWDVTDDAVQAASFSDYLGHRRYGIKFVGLSVAELDGLAVTRIPTVLSQGQGQGQRLFFWCAEVPASCLEDIGLYGLFRIAAKLSAGASVSGCWRRYGAVTIPAQQIKYLRNMDEIVSMNPAVVSDVEQTVSMALDESGVRVVARTSLRTGRAPLPPPPPTEYVFGAKAAVLTWITQHHPAAGGPVPADGVAPGSLAAAGDEAWLPLAVIYSTSSDWLDPQGKVSFEDRDLLILDAP